MRLKCQTRWPAPSLPGRPPPILRGADSDSVGGPRLRQCDRIAFLVRRGGIGIDLVEEDVSRGHGAQASRRIGTSQHQDAAGEFLGQHRVASIARPSGGHPLPKFYGATNVCFGEAASQHPVTLWMAALGRELRPTGSPEGPRPQHYSVEPLGPVTLSCRSKCSFKPLSVRKRRGFPIQGKSSGKL